MSKVLTRILLFFVGLPLILALTLWDWAYHFRLALVAVFVCALAS